MEKEFNLKYIPRKPRKVYCLNCGGAYFTKAKPKAKEESTGGATRIAHRMRGF